MALGALLGWLPVPASLNAGPRRRPGRSRRVGANTTRRHSRISSKPDAGRRTLDYIPVGIARPRRPTPAARQPLRSRPPRPRWMRRGRATRLAGRVAGAGWRDQPARPRRRDAGGSAAATNNPAQTMQAKAVKDARAGRRAASLAAAVLNDSAKEYALMTDFHRIRRLPPYVFEQVNRLKAARAPPAPTSSTSAWAIRTCRRRSTSIDKLIETVGKPRTNRYSASRGITGLRRAQAAYYGAPLRREARPGHAGRRDPRLEGGLRQHGAGDHRAGRRGARARIRAIRSTPSAS